MGQFLAGAGGRRQFRRLDDTGAKAGLNLPTVGSLLVAVPEPAEQRDLAARLDAADERVRREQVAADKLRLLKHGLMHDLLTGRVRVRVEGEDAA